MNNQPRDRNFCFHFYYAGWAKREIILRNMTGSILAISPVPKNVDYNGSLI